ncbi:hypothetical protein [Chromobacterium violaceum]|uniref:Amidase domain-containing protein n=1 Tax=Chromobacterium violaceum TaxID=536 RepID=A0AAX2M846_CHRVL|nr:hypothetical protein [Chromobacterium violaceum]OLZ70653.1 hypothetical protein BS642_21080 [Chromobacterium violaceum]STB70544.1 Uncharacterised protein [Chromobacterium violaceum]SUX32670.1 Uncharacterised protein [Chromobacterium violaceum]
MSGAEMVSAKLTHKSKTDPHVVKLKVFWKTTKKWAESDIADFQASVPAIVEILRNEQYWDKDGSIHQSKFTCEDFAIRVLAQYAASKGLPVKLTTGTRTYRNMEIYKPDEHDRYVNDMWGFAQMAMLTYGAPDMQRIGVNTVKVDSAEALKPGDILALAHDAKGRSTGGTAHHIQVVSSTSAEKIGIYQGNSNNTIHRPITWIYRAVGKNIADPQQSAYGGLPVEMGVYTKAKAGWDYSNLKTGNTEKDFLKYFDLVRWNFMEFNK